MTEAVRSFVASIIEALFHLTEAVNIPSYALALIVFTIIIKVAMYPLNRKQMLSMKGIQIVQPELNEINKKYANNPQKRQEEMMRIYQENNINPMAGCLPMLIQLPIIIMLYQGILYFVPENPEYFKFLWISDLSQPDPTGFVFAIIIAAATFLQSFTSMGIPKEPMQKYMLFGMPLFMAYLSFSFPSGVALYWITFSILGAIQQILTNKALTPQRAKEREEKKKMANGEIPAVVDAKVKPVKNPQQNQPKNKNNNNKNKKKK